MAKSDTEPPWVLAALGGLVIALIGYVAVVGGPEKAWLGVRSFFWGHPSPRIVSVEAERESATIYLVTVRNPATEDVVITGYEADTLKSDENEPTVKNAVRKNSGPTEGGGGWAPKIVIDEQLPNACGNPRYVHLPRPVIIEPGRTVVLRIEPWNGTCPFDVRVNSDHGDSDRAGPILPPIDPNAFATRNFIRGR